MSDSEEVVFARSEGADDDEDIWDDTALIEAYDKAINMVKESISNNGSSAAACLAGSGKSQSSAKKKRNEEKGKEKEKRKRNNGRPVAAGKQIDVGDHCQAVYSEDGLWYEGEVIAVDRRAQTCVVRYTGYGNEEEHSINDVVLTEADGTPPPDSSDKDCHKMEWSPHSRRHGDPAGTSQQHDVVTAISHGKDVHLPSIPPPPPLLGESENDTDEGSALSSMLISWYMSGYHTGYYQGLKDGKRQSSESRKH